MTEDETRQLDEMWTMVEALFQASERFVTEFGTFLPHGAALDDQGLRVVGAAPENEMTNSAEVLPILHDGLRTLTAQARIQAVGVSESVFIEADRKPAIKVLAEHRDGMAVALYRTHRKRLLRAPVFGEIFMVPAEAEVGGWG